MKWNIIVCAMLGMALTLPRSAPAAETTPLATGPRPTKDLVPFIVAGAAPDSPALHVDANTTTSPFAGVGSVFIDSPPVNDGFGFLCSGCAIHGFTIGKRVVRDYVLMAAHCLDFTGGLDDESQPTGDGVPDVAPQDVTFVLNFGGNLTSFLTASEIHLNPNWHGFLNAAAPEGLSVNDDIALIRLSAPVPVGVPTYNLSTTFSGLVETISPVGYGVSGGPDGFSVAQSFTVKRTGLNRADRYYADDEFSPEAEVFEADFDGPDGSTNVIDLGLPGFDPLVEGTLGNNLEVTLGPGDSGGPTFLGEFSSGTLELGSDGKPIVYGINTFGSGNAPEYGSTFGGMLVSRYASWIDSIIVPEPSATWLYFLGSLPIAIVRRRR